MGEKLTLRNTYEREFEISKITLYIQQLESEDLSLEEKKTAKVWLEKKLLEYTRAQNIYGVGISDYDSTAEQGGILEELRDMILTALAKADAKNKLS